MAPEIRQAQLDVDPLRLDRCWQWLSADEQDRARRFHFDRDRKRWVAARGWLREQLAQKLGSAPSQLHFEYSERGKPSLKAGGLAFNLSHSAGQALLALLPSGEVGVDIEEVRPGFEWQGVASYAFSAAENEALRQAPGDSQLGLFYSVWTRKEAYVKTTGCGLMEPTSGFSVWPWCDLEPEWAIEELDLGPRFRGAVCWRKTGDF